MRVALPLSLTLVAAALWPAEAAARPLSLQPDDRPWTRGTLMPSFGLGGSFYSRGGGNLLVAAGLSYFFVNNLAVGLQLRNFTTFLGSYYKETFPGIEKQIPTNEFSLIPGMTAVLYRSYRFSPYVSAGVGPVFLNHKHGVVGEWNAGPGVLIGLGRRLALDLGVSFSMRFPDAKCDRAFTYGDGPPLDACGFRWGIRAGLVFGFGVGRQHNPPPPPPQNNYSAPPETSPGYAEPAPPPAYEPAPTPTAEPETVPPAGPAPTPAAPPTTTPPPADPAAPLTTPTAPASPPPGESVPISPPPG